MYKQLKKGCLSFNLSQIINTPTHPSTKFPGRLSILDLFISNMPHKFSGLGVFADDMSDHCVVRAIRDTKLPCAKPRLILKMNTKHFSE